MSSLRKVILTAALLMEWLLFTINPILLTDAKVATFIIASIVITYAPELQGESDVDWGSALSLTGHQDRYI